MAHIVILGAGLTGLSVAYHLEKSGYSDYALFEKESAPGGLCRSVYQDGFTFDFTGHLLHVSDPYFRALLDELVSFETMENIIRRSFIYSQDIYSRYPYQVNLFGLPTKTITDCIQGYLTRPRIKNPQSFYQWVLANFGAGFGKYFFFDYQRKIFSYDVKKLTASWTGRFVPQTTLDDLIQGAIKDKSDDLIGYNSTFYYPKSGGINDWVQKLANAITKPIHTQCTVTSINLAHKTISFSNGHVEPYTILINTIPLDTTLNILKEPASTHLKAATTKLRCASVVNFNLGIARENVSDKHWIYFPEKQFPFYRLGFYHNFSKANVPTGCSSLYGEFSYITKSKKEIEAMLEASIHHATKLLNIHEQEIITKKILYISHGYVIYNAWRDKHIPALLNTLKKHNIHNIGRYGAWKYSSMQEAVLEGRDIAAQLLKNQA